MMASALYFLKQTTTGAVGVFSNVSDKEIGNETAKGNSEASGNGNNIWKCLDATKEVEKTVIINI